MGSFGEALRAIRENLKMSQDEFAQKLGTSKQVISRYETEQRIPKISVVKEYADKLGVPLVQLTGDVERLPDNILPIKKCKIRILGNVAAGVPMYAEEDYDSYVLADEHIRCDFALRACGDSMINARINDGDIVFVREQPDVNDGDIAVVVVDDSATLKRVYKMPDGVTLVSENPKYKPMIYTRENSDYIRILGKAVAFQSKL